MKRLFNYSIIATAVLFLLTGCNSAKTAVEDEFRWRLPAADGGALYMGLYASVFEGNCALAACHDGSFEPNFTTPQSAYYTTVYHDVIKNNWESTYQYRIVPYRVDKSLLFDRITNCCFIDENDRMPVLMEPLTKDQIDSIAFWINVGAPNWDGEFTYEKILADNEAEETNGKKGRKQ